MMIAIEKKIGRPTSVAARSVISPICAAILAMLLEVLLGMPQHVFGHHDSRIDQHADGDGDASERHDVGGDAGVAHEQERGQDCQRQRNRDNENAAEVPQEDDVRERDQDDFFDQRSLQACSTA